ncbi:sugar ABC transporter permease [Bradyrhizobium sp. UFLA 03-164]|uniref:Sugar ABC transporter permease n=2 Tax=Bradyrhizobium uaiense TaxID=2594946 RepID=A0A6P1BKL4_9BRAD|nr:sugar ABC transporter permease [Bradyrhizobium uaiense]
MGQPPVQEDQPSLLHRSTDAVLRRLRLAESLTAYALAGPGVVLLLTLYILPVAGVLFIAFTDWQFGAKTLSFVGLRNFAELFADSEFRKVLANTAVYTLIVVPGTIVLSLAVALVIESGQTMRAFYRAVHFLPYMATLAAMAITWEALLHPTVGLLNQLMTAAGLPTANWLRDERTVLPILAVIGIWQNLGFAMVLILAGLAAIPRDLYDAADVDGIDVWFERLRLITLPMLGPVLMFVVIVVTLHALKVFDTVQVLTQGGPNHASDVLLYTLYRESFQYLRTGYGAAVTVVFLVIVMALTLIQARIMDRKVHYQ